MVTVAEAREVIRKAFEEDPDFRHTYVANIAMCVFDSQTYEYDNSPAPDLRTIAGCSVLADRLVKLIFE